MEHESRSNTTISEFQNKLEHLQYDYFSSSNALCRHIISEQKALMKHLEGTWDDLDCKRKDALLDLLFVDDDIRGKYSTYGRDDSQSDNKDMKESFPTLYVDSGQKIHVDYENDLWTWRDEHSGPFSWMSRSQQDLTLLDLEPENISKPQPKTAKGDSDSIKSKKTAQEQFSYPVNSWSRDVIDEFKIHERDIVISACPSLYFTPKSSENYEKPDSNDEVDLSDIIVEETPKEIVIDTSSQDAKTVIKERRKRSPSPKKIKRSSSLRRSPSKSSDQGEQMLITNKNEDAYEERNTFSNPVMETEWSNFIGNETDANPSSQSEVNPPIQSEPGVQVMDRGQPIYSNSPYQGDRVHLISPTDSPSQASGISAHLASSGLSNCSAESTPDHSTHLLKGMQQMDDTSFQYTDIKKEQQTSNLELEEEVLKVESDGENLNITSEKEVNRTSDIPTTGFDFLDNW